MDEVRRTVEQTLSTQASSIRGLDMLSSVLRHDPQRLAGNGEAFPLTVRGQPFEARVRIEVTPTSGTGASGPRVTSEPSVRGERGTDQTNTRAPGWQPSVSARFGAVGGYGGARVKFQLPSSTTTTHAARATVGDERAIKASHDPEQDIPARVHISVTDRQGRPVGDGGAVPGTARGWSYPVELDAQPGPSRMLDDGSGATMTDVVPHSVRTDGGRDLHSQVAGLLPPKVTAMGAPGRQDLHTFLSDHGLRNRFTAMLHDWVSSPPLVSSDGRHRAQVQARLVPETGSRAGRLSGGLTADSRAEFVADRSAKSEGGGELELSGGARTSPHPIGGGGAMSVSVGGSAQRETRTTHIDVYRKAHTMSGPVDLHDLGMRLEVRVVVGPRNDAPPHGGSVTAGVDARVWMTPGQAAKVGLAAGADAAGSAAGPGGGTMHPPAYLAHGLGLGDARVRSLGSGPRDLLAQARSALAQVPGYRELVADPESGAVPHSRTSTVAPITDLHRTLENFLSHEHLSARMDSILAGGIDQPFVREGGTATTYVNLNVRGHLDGVTDTGPVSGSGLKVVSGGRARLGHTAGAKRSVGVGFSAWAVFGVPLALLSAVASLGGKYQWRRTTGAGPEIGDQFTTRTGSDVHEVQGRIRYEITVTEHHRAADWVRTLPVGKPGLHQPAVTTVVRTRGPGETGGTSLLEPLESPITLHVPADDLRSTPVDRPPAPPSTEPLPNPPRLDGPTEPGTPLSPHSSLLVVGGAATIKKAALDALGEATHGDEVLTLAGSSGAKALSDALSPERLITDRALLRGGIVVEDLVYERRLVDRVGAVRVAMTVENPTLIPDGDRLPVSTDRTQQAAALGGYTVKSGKESTWEFGVRGTGSVGDRTHSAPMYAGDPAPMRAGDPPRVVGSGQVSAELTLSRTTGTANSASAGGERSVLASGRRTFAVQADGLVTVTAQARLRNVVRDAVAPAPTGLAGRQVRLPGAVFLRVDEVQARAWGLLPAPLDRPGLGAGPHGAGSHGAGSHTAGHEQPSSPTIPGRPALDTVVLENPDILGDQLGALADRLRGSDSGPLPHSVLGDAMATLHRIREQLTETTAHGLLGSLLGPGVPLLNSEPRLLGHTDVEVRLVAKRIDPPRSLGLVHDGADIRDKVTSVQSDERTRATAIGIRGTTSATLGTRRPGPSHDGSSALAAGPTGTVGRSSAHKGTDSDVTRTVRITNSKGPSARFTMPVRLQVEVRSGGALQAQHVGRISDLVLRAPADDLSTLPQPPRDTSPPPPSHPAPVPGPDGKPSAARTHEAALTWQAQGSPLPEQLRVVSAGGGPAAVDHAVVSLLHEAGIDPRLTHPGGPVRHGLDALMSPEMWRALGPQMLRGGWTLPTLHSTEVGGPSVRVQIYARTTSPVTHGVSHSFDVTDGIRYREGRDTEFVTTRQRGAGGTLAPSGRQPIIGQGTADLGATVRSENTATPKAGGHEPNENTRSGATRLVGGPTEYRVVVEVDQRRPWSAPRVLVADVHQDAGLTLRMTEGEAEARFGPLPEPVSRHAEEVRDAAARWRTAEKALEKLTGERDALWWAAPPADRMIIAATGDAHTAEARAASGAEQLADLEFRVDALTAMVGADPLGSSALHAELTGAQAEVAALKARIARDGDLARVLRDHEKAGAARDQARAEWMRAKAALDQALAAVADGGDAGGNTTATVAVGDSLSAEDFDRIVNPGPAPGLPASVSL
ncbi:cell envelope integrity protein TolA [Pseudonocardia acidicola]|uniref:Uncharacterized protein n=1 Tax=Pseudonocardia acidicola TaxID=2724939 RepID=A0ABX1SA69_9PSEU|nr:cell envelope integrity protein TolA [Pseudonocardia acidicola]NMH97814.1 hypothetical protein [Pseudonocardia acidicola]